ncbi:MAG: hypothetical protein KDN19_09840 [Verrucomicrobiae bacterium]|nr:hypothetical protein [Verrucomicrobiae bacterium]
MSRYLAITLVALVLLSLSPTAIGQPSSASGLTILRQFASERSSDELSRVVGLVGFHGQDQPARWLLLQIDGKVPNLMHEFAIENGHIVAQRQFWKNPSQDLPTIPLKISAIGIDSTRAFRLADQSAKKAGIGFDAVHYQLRCRDLRNEPIWVLNLVNDAQRSVGVLYISAVSGETLRSVWYQPGATTSTGTPSGERPRGLIPQLADRIRDNGGATQPPPPAGFSAPPVPPRTTR